MRKLLIFNMEGIRNRLNICGDTGFVQPFKQSCVCVLFTFSGRTSRVPLPSFPGHFVGNMVEATLLFAKGKDRGPHTLEFRISSALHKCVGQEGPSH